MKRKASPELGDRLARLETPGTPASADLDWFLFQSFPDCSVSPGTFVKILPRYEAALRAGARFDYELLFVRCMELHEKIGLEALRDLARAAMNRMKAGGFDPGDALTALRFAIRVIPAEDAFLDDILESSELASLRFHWTVDFVLDDRELADYLALSYLRDADPETASVASAFPVPPVGIRKLGRMLEPDACRVRLESGWEAETDPSERDALAAVLAEKLGRFAGSTRRPRA